MTKESEEDGPSETHDKAAEGKSPWCLETRFDLVATPVT